MMSFDSGQQGFYSLNSVLDQSCMMADRHLPVQKCLYSYHSLIEMTLDTMCCPTVTIHCVPKKIGDVGNETIFR